MIHIFTAHFTRSPTKETHVIEVPGQGPFTEIRGVEARLVASGEEQTAVILYRLAPIAPFTYNLLEYSLDSLAVRNHVKLDAMDAPQGWIPSDFAVSDKSRTAAVTTFQKEPKQVGVWIYNLDTDSLSHFVLPDMEMWSGGLAPNIVLGGDSTPVLFVSGHNKVAIVRP